VSFYTAVINESLGFPLGL